MQTKLVKKLLGSRVKARSSPTGEEEIFMNVTFGRPLYHSVFIGLGLHQNHGLPNLLQDSHVLVITSLLFSFSSSSLVVSSKVKNVN